MMKATNTKSRIKSIVVTAIACLAFLLSAFISFAFDARPASAADGEGETYDIANEAGIRFVQVAAGEDFAIGLTLDRKLYGWSLDEGSENSLGSYYSATPTLIPYKLIAGPSARVGDSAAKWGSTDTQDPGIKPYHEEVTDDRILQIAATRTTAAFITEKGYIYTWGKDDTKDVNEGYSNLNSKPHYLLMRPCDETNDFWHTPYMIDYGYYDGEAAHDPFKTITPGGATFSNMSIAGGENNYIFVFNSNGYHSYVWGSLLYVNVQHEGYGKYSMLLTDNYTGAGGYSLNDVDGNTYRKVYKTQYGSAETSHVTAVAGGYNVGFNGNNSAVDNATSLTLRGKNFLTNHEMKYTSVTSEETTTHYLEPVVTVATNKSNYNTTSSSNQESNSTSSLMYYQGTDSTVYEVKNAILGGFASSTPVNGIVYANGYNAGIGDADQIKNADLYYARQAVATTGSDRMVYSVSKPEGSIYNTYNGSAWSGDYAKIIRNAVSLGNDIGYGISKDGALYAWGDNMSGQSGYVYSHDSGAENGISSSATHYSYPRNITKKPDGSTSTVTNPLDGKKFISVAAGKQLSPDNTKKAFNSTSTLDTASLNNAETTGSGKVYFGKETGTNKPLYENDSAFITGAIAAENLTDEAGSLYVWSDVNKVPQEIIFGGVATGNVNDYNKFAAVYSGYGHHLFAITKLGRLVHITLKRGDSGNYSYDAKIMDEFSDTLSASPTVQDNWTSASDGSNSARFSVTAGEGSWNSPALLGDLTFYVNSATLSQNTISLNGATNKYSVPTGYAERNSLVTKNLIGDAYRILDNTDADANINFLFDKGTKPSSFAPEFEFYAKGSSTGVELKEQREFMFGYSYVYDDNGVGIKIEPEQSSKEGTVRMYFYIARYDCAKNYVIAGGRKTSDKAVYYDYKKVSVDFKIDNTEAYKTYDSAISDKDHIIGKSRIPLLDPNNNYNKVYSIAVQNISAGIDEFAKVIVGDAQATTFGNEIRAYMKGDRGDAGYPAAEKIDKGDLKYYLGNDAAGVYYSDTYQYMFADRDADIIKLNSSFEDEKIHITDNSAVTAELQPITVTLDVSSYNIAETTAADVIKKFNNLYGIYGIEITNEDSKVKTVTFKYDVVQFTAAGTTGRIKNTDGKVSSFVTDESEENSYVSYTIKDYSEYSQFTSNFAIDTSKPTVDGTDESTERNWPKFAYVFSQASLRLKYKNGDDESAHVIYGKAGSGSTEYVFPVNTDIINVGTTKTVYLSDLFDGGKVNSGFIAFSYQDEMEYGEFNDQFPDELDPEKTIVDLKSDRIEITPTTERNIYFTVTVQRFYNDGTNANAAFKENNEKVKLSFAFEHIVGIQLTKNTNFNEEYDIEKVSTIDLWGNNSALNGNNPLIVTSDVLSKERYESKVSVTGLRSSDTSIATVSRSGSVITVTPHASGSAEIQFVFSILDKSLPVSITVNVSGITVIKVSSGTDTKDMKVSLNGTQYIYITELKTALRNAIGSFNDAAKNELYTILYDAKNSAGNLESIYFTEYDEKTKTEKELTDRYYPPYIGSVEYRDTGTGSLQQRDDKNAYIRIETDASKASAEDMSKVYRMHVRFVNKNTYDSESYYHKETVDGENGTTNEIDVLNEGIIEAVFSIDSTQKIAVGDTGGMLSITADVDNPYAGNKQNLNEDWYMVGSNTEAEIYVPLTYLLRRAGITPDNYEIFLVSAEEGATKFFNYTFIPGKDSKVVITPIYNTVEKTTDENGKEVEVPIALTVNVSAKKTQGESLTNVVSFEISVDGISTHLTKSDYTTIWLVAFFSSLGLLLIIFLIRMIVYWRRRAKQRALIKRNQELIKMRDRIHNRTAAVSRDQALRTKLKMDDPKYAKMFNDMKKERMGDSATVDGSTFATSTPSEGKKSKKKKNGKKSMAELKAELAAKKAAFAQAQNADPGAYGAQPVNPFTDVPVDGGDFAQNQGYGMPDQGFGAPDQNFGSPADAFGASDLDGNAIIFDAPDMGDGSQG